MVLHGHSFHVAVVIVFISSDNYPTVSQIGNKSICVHVVIWNSGIICVQKFWLQHDVGAGIVFSKNRVPFPGWYWTFLCCFVELVRQTRRQLRRRVLLVEMPRCAAVLQGTVGVARYLFLRVQTSVLLVPEFDIGKGRLRLCVTVVGDKNLKWVESMTFDWNYDSSERHASCMSHWTGRLGSVVLILFPTAALWKQHLSVSVWQTLRSYFLPFCVQILSGSLGGFLLREKWWRNTALGDDVKEFHCKKTRNKLLQNIQPGEDPQEKHDACRRVDGKEKSQIWTSRVSSSWLGGLVSSPTGKKER